MLLERPIREALRLYAFQLAGLLIIVNFFVCIFAVVFCVERLGIVAHDYTVYSTSTSSSPAWLIGAIGLLLVVVSLVSLIALFFQVADHAAFPPPPVQIDVVTSETCRPVRIPCNA